MAMAGSSGTDVVGRYLESDLGMGWYVRAKLCYLYILGVCSQSASILSSIKNKCASKRNKDKMASRNLFYVAAAALLASRAGAVNNGLAITPQMGCELPFGVIVG